MNDTLLLYTIPHPSSKLRLFSVGYGAAVFLWLMPENDPLIVVWGLGLVGALLMTVWAVRRLMGGRRVMLTRLVVGSALAGAGVGGGGIAAAAGLMFFKNALHAHDTWDYPPALLAALLERAPGWGLAGAMMGIGLSLLWIWITVRQLRRTA